MEFQFSARIGDSQYHIRGYHDHFLPNETVDERPHMHYFMEFHCIFAGVETIHLPGEDRYLHLLPGQILLLPRAVYHGVQTPKGADVERLCFNLTVEPESEDTVSQLYLSLRQPVLFQDPAANALMAQCRDLYLSPTGTLQNRRKGLLLLTAVLQLFSTLAPDTAQGISISDSMRQKWIIEQYIEQHFTDNEGLEGLAKELFLSQRQTRKLVQRFMGADFKTVLIRRRMELASIYLRDESKTLEEIAWQVGYRSYSGFQLCFKRFYGITPSERRHQLQNKEGRL